MSTKKTLLMSAAATTVGVAMFAGVASAQATTTNTNQQTLVDKIAQRFNLDKNEVQKVFDEAHTERQAERDAKIAERLDQAVTDGKITPDQKDAILKKLQEFHDFHDSIKDKPREERQKLMQAKHDELKKWAEEQGLSQYLPLAQGRPARGNGLGAMGANTSQN